MKSLETLLKQTVFSDEEIVYLLGLKDEQDCRALQKAAYDRTTELMGSNVYYRGLIEVSNVCTSDCRYCGIRKDNHSVPRFEMTKEDCRLRQIGG